MDQPRAGRGLEKGEGLGLGHKDDQIRVVARTLVHSNEDETCG